MKTQPITLETLQEMQSILNDSAGYNVSIEDEVESFDPNMATGWFFIRNLKGQICAFIRHFNQNSEWSLGEIFVSSNIPDRMQIASALLDSFNSSVYFPTGHRLRFDIYSSDSELNKALTAKGFSDRHQTYFHFERMADERVDESYIDIITIDDANEIADVLTHLHAISGEETKKLIQSNVIRGVRCDGKIVAAAQIFESDDALAVNRFATHKHFLRNGFAKRLMGQIFAEAKRLQKNKVYLKVEDSRVPAISFYRSVGFMENKDKRQTWHSRWY